jgi:hypothetical protein
MTDLLDQALEVVRALPRAEQDEIARAMLSLAESSQEPEEIDPDHLPHVLEGLAQARRGERATQEQVDAAYRRFVR